MRAAADDDDDYEALSESDDEMDDSDDAETRGPTTDLRADRAKVRDFHLERLRSSSVAELRRLLRDAGEATLATVKQADLPEGTAATGPEKSTAVRALLRSRAATVLADRDCADTPPPLPSHPWTPHPLLVSRTSRARPRAPFPPLERAECGLILSTHASAREFQDPPTKTQNAIFLPRM